jgi:multiple sugar transport system permease protein
MRSKTDFYLHKKSNVLTVVMLGVASYFLIPILWLFISTTKSVTGLYNSFGLWFSDENLLWFNLKNVFTFDDGIYMKWIINTFIYAVVGSFCAAFIATMAGYGFSKYRFRGSKPMFGLVLGSIMIPSTALAIPTFLVFSQLNLVNTRWAILIPSVISPLGVYLMRVYSDSAVPQNLIEAARIDGLREFRIFTTISLRLLAPGFVTVVLLSIVGIWNNYFLPQIMLNSPELQPLTVGLAGWSARSTSAGGGADASIQSTVLTGAGLSIIPLIIVFLFLQRYWENGLSAGAVKE